MQQGRLDMLGFLSKRGIILIDPKSKIVEDALWSSVVTGNSAMVECFLKQGYDPNMKMGEENPQTYLKAAAMAQDAEAAAATLDILLRHGADITKL